MNLVGKIFTVLIFLMSVVFAAFAVAVHATHKNWLTEADARYKQLTDAREQNTELLKKKKEVEEEKQIEKVRSDKRLAELETENQDLKKERTAHEKAIAELQAQVRDAVAAMKATHETLAALRTQVDTLRGEIKTAQTDRDLSFKKVVDLTDQLHNAVNERLRLEKLGQGLGEQLAKARECLHYYNLNENTRYMDKEPPAGLQGEITGAPRPDLVEVSIGSDDGLRKGHKLEVIRVGGGLTSYVGRIEVIETSPERAVCRTDPKMLKSPIQKGDRVYANLSQVR